MSNAAKAAEHAEIAERLLSHVNLDDVTRRQGFNPREAQAGQIAAAHASLAIYYRGLED